ncbi:MAG: tetratricopeptide repeat protein [Cyanobacteria bacterium REEB67]|nr:tetratricopeptide repeat protein [Cyanobacteria bacterium REEB67]
MRAANIELAEIIYMASVYCKRRFYAEATCLLTEALNSAQDSKDLSTSAMVQFTLARVYEEQGNHFFAKELYQQALNDWLGGKAANPIRQIWPFRSLSSIERACGEMIKQVEQRSEIQNLPLPQPNLVDRRLKAG